MWIQLEYGESLRYIKLEDITSVYSTEDNSLMSLGMRYSCDIVITSDAHMELSEPVILIEKASPEDVAIIFNNIAELLNLDDAETVGIKRHTK